MSAILLFEIRYRLTRPATWIYALIWLALGTIMLATDGARIGGGYGKVFTNSPYNIHQIMAVLGAMGLFVTMAFHAVPVYRDFEHKADTFLYAYPIRKNQYLAGRFWGTFLVCAGVFAFLPLGMMIGEFLGRNFFKTEDEWGPFSPTSYFWPFLIAVLPTLFLTGSLFFTLVNFTRKLMPAYVVALFVVVFYGLGLSLLSDLDNKELGSLLDPFGLNAAGFVTDYWSISEKNLRLVPLEGVYLWNRLLWTGAGALTLAAGMRQFRMSPVSDRGGKTAAEKISEPAAAQVRSPPLPEPRFGGLSTFMTLWTLELRQTYRNGLFLSMLIAIAAFLGQSAWQSDVTYETGIYPLTGAILDSVTSSLFTILVLVTLAFLAGEIVWRERTVKMEGVYDAFPVSNALVFYSKLAALLTVPVFFVAIVPPVCMAVQIMKGYYDFQPGLYLQTLLLFELPRYWLMAILAFAAQVLVNQKFAGNVSILLYYLAGIGLSYLDIDHPLFAYASRLTYVYSDMNGFGDYVRPFSTFLLHWTLVGIFLLSIAYFFLVRGPESHFRARLKLAKARFRQSGTARAVGAFAFAGMMATGAWISYQTLENDRYQSSGSQEKEQARYEKTYGYLKRRPHPVLRGINIGADMYPENGGLLIRSSGWYANESALPIDTLWFSVNPEGRNLKMLFSIPVTPVVSRPDWGLYAYKTTRSLAPGDSFELKFEHRFAFTGLSNESPVKGNGTFFDNNYWPQAGFNSSFELSDDDKRRENGLPPRPAMVVQTDSANRMRSIFDPVNHYIRFEATLSTAPDQIAIAPGYLRREWTENGRRKFHYVMDRPINNFFSVLSARYAVYQEKWNGIDISIYHHPAHTFNLKKMAESVRHSLACYTRAFGPYQHRQVRILEFPRYASFAQSFDNTIPYSEGIGFIANLKEPDAIDYVYFVTAHEMSHQWWGHQINPANVRGGQFLSETMSEYAALTVMRERYGKVLMGRFLRRELDIYLNGRSSETRKEDPLLDIESQSYAYYNKGSLAMYRVMELLGEEPMTRFLNAFVSRYRFSHRPYPTTHDFYHALEPYIPAGMKEAVDDQLMRITLYRNKVISAKGKKTPQGDFEVNMEVQTEKFYADSLGGSETSRPFREPVTLALLTDDKPKQKSDVLVMESKIVTGKARVTMRSKVKPVYAAIDPLHTLTEIQSSDNQIKIDWE